MKRAVRRPRVAILGCGHVGRALAVELLSAKRPPLRGKLLVWSRSRRSVGALRRLVLGQDAGNDQRLRVCASAGEALAGADVVLLCVADGALDSFARELARVQLGARRPVVLFTNGYLPLATLSPLKRRRLAVGRMHPLAPVPGGMELFNLSLAHYALEGDSRALRAARALVAGIEGSALYLRPGAAPAYHAGASLFGGGLVALFDQAERVMARAVKSPAALRAALIDFAGNVVDGVERLGPARALTGALSRGSEPLVRGHLRALQRARGAHALYCLLGERMLALAEARGSIGVRQRRTLGTLLKAARRHRTRASKLNSRSAGRSR